MTKYLTFLSAIILCSINNLIAQENTLYQKEEVESVFLNHEATINSKNLEYSPAFFEDGIVFISSQVSSKRFKIKDKRIGENVMSIFLSRRDESGLLQKPTPFAPELLSSVHEGPLTFDRTASNIFFTRNNIKDGKKIKAKKDKLVKLQIFQAERVGEKWKNIKLLPFNGREFNTAHPTISADGDILYFASDRDGGIGGMDIWMVKRNGDDWSEPINLGPTVNTEQDDIFPYVHADGTLYFASSGHNTFGGLDIFYTKPKGNNWEKVTNLGKPFNSEKDDFGLIIDRDKKNGYFSSNRTGGYGEDDIYSFFISGGFDALFDDTKPTVIQDYTINVINENKENIEGVSITHTNLDNLLIGVVNGNNQIDIDQPIPDSTINIGLSLNDNAKKGVTDNWGKYIASLPTGKHAFIIKKPGYQTIQRIIDTENSDTDIYVSLQPMSETIVDDAIVKNERDGSVLRYREGKSGNHEYENYDENGNPIASTTGNEEGFERVISEGTTFTLPNIYYNFNDASIRPDSKVDLDALVQFLNQYPDVHIEVSSHTDARGNEEYNRKLSQKRADNAVKYLEKQGIDSYRLSAVGYGEDEIRNHCTDGVDCTEDEHQYNRRTVVKITKMSEAINIQFYNDDSNRPVASSGSSSSSSDDYEENDPSDENIVEFRHESGQYTVITGIYSKHKNAKKKIRRLANKGYDAQIQTFGDYYYIIVETFYDEDSALELQSSLTNDDIDSYLKK